ncbi:MAG: hypothetical protein K0S23_762 [Fluviicola sp.]|jgi:hypothetical protein|uniref:hypothetical protein n=1 Tax=Fluviicola sp. TaxID=1917219 RepID=UPI00261C6316|nr:hypothetical protein [Fluviicola sp.]MDF3026455.1 hypothetical protein [Fluviicola sp.]
MKQKNLFILLLIFLLGNNSFAQNKENIISNIQVQPDFVENGVKGLRISVLCDFPVLRKKYPTDSLLNIALGQAKFTFILSLFQDSNQVKPAFGYQSAFGRGDFLEIKLKCDPQFSDSKPLSVNHFVFIPYAALKLKEGKQNLSVSADLYGKDGFNTPYKQNTRSTVFSFTKPLTKIFECSLDSLVVKPFDNQGQAWDHELFGTDAPDLDFSIKMGDLEVGNIHKGNNYFISFAAKPRVFRFLVSENDEVTIFLTDTDDAFHDPIASWRFNTTNMKEGTVYQQKEAKENLTAFSFKCKVGKVKD